MDAVDLEVFRAICLGVVDEVEVNLTRTAYSPLVYEYKDYCVSLLDADFSLVTQSRGSLPIFLADMGLPVADAVKVIGADTLEPGDAFITNYARVAGQHLNNVILAQPIFLADEVFGYFCIRAHWADVGGLVPGSMSWEADSIYQEGVQYRGLIVCKAGELRPDALATVEANTRMPKYVMGDLMAQLGAATLGVQRLTSRLLERWRPEEIRELVRRQYDESEQLARSAIAALRSGSFDASVKLDDSGAPGTDPLEIGLTVRIDGDTMTVDLRNMPAQVAAPMNAGGHGGGVSAVRVAYKSLIAPDRPADEGLFRPLNVEMREGTLVTAHKDAPMAHWNLALPSVIDLVFRAIGSEQPEVVPAGHHATLGTHLFYGTDENGEVWQLVDTASGGWGASKDADGFSPIKTLFHGDNRDFPVEVVEARYPIFVESYGFDHGSGGAGRHRGGDGTRKRLRMTGPASIETAIDRTIEPAWGLNGGMPGRGGDIRICLPGGEWQSHKKTTRLSLPEGTLVEIVSGSGGGWGAPDA